jgi:phenylalanyl-tRNA synthetase beta chain
MKIAYSHIVQNILENPSMSEISNSLFQLGHEHEIDGNIFDIEFTPNRGDCLSVIGLLRDLAVFYNVEINLDTYTKEIEELHIDFQNLSQNICPKILFLKLEIDKVPNEYKGYLNNYFEDMDLNKNNFFADVSNYLSYETGQPTHCYDASKMNGKLVFDELSLDEEFETLLDKKINLSNKNVVFSLNDEVINLAGVVGGKNTACSLSTNTVIVECAFFEPEAIIGKSVKYDIHSESSHKFERGVDPECHEAVLRRFIKIVSEHALIKNVSIAAYNYKNKPIHKIPIKLEKVNQIIGINVSNEEYLSYMSKLSFDIKGDYFYVPSFRSDVKTQNDLAEEVARVIGYDNIKPSEICIPKNSELSNKNIENKVRLFLLDHGFYEVINSPFVSIEAEKAIKIDNPLDSNRKLLRTSITNSLIENLLFNERRQKDSIKLFEISDIYTSGKGIHKNRRLSIIASGRVGLNFEDFSKKITKKYISDIFKKILPNEKLSFNNISRDKLDTKIKSEIVSFEINIDSFAEDALSYSEISQSPRHFNKYSPISELPSSFKDISYSIKDYSKAEALQVFLLNYQNDIIKHIYIFDYFYNQKKQEIKIGFRFIFQSQKLTLTSAEIDVVYNDIIDKSLEISGVAIPGIK